MTSNQVESHELLRSRPYRKQTQKEHVSTYDRTTHFRIKLRKSFKGMYLMHNFGLKICLLKASLRQKFAFLASLGLLNSSKNNSPLTSFDDQL